MSKEIRIIGLWTRDRIKESGMTREILIQKAGRPAACDQLAYELG